MVVDQEEIVKYVMKNNEKFVYVFVLSGFMQFDGKDFCEVGGDLVMINESKVKQLLEKGMKEENYDKFFVIIFIYSIKLEYKKIVEVIQ